MHKLEHFISCSAIAQMRHFGTLIKFSTNTFELYHKLQKKYFLTKTTTKYETTKEDVEKKDEFSALFPVNLFIIY